MILSYFLTFCILIIPFSNAASSSESCIWISGPDGVHKKCARQSDADGTIAGSVAEINGQNGRVGAGAGTPDNFSPDYQQIGEA